MSNRILSRADDNPGEILEDGERHKVGMWDEIVIERSAAGAPGLLFVMTRYDNGTAFDQMCVTVPDGATFLAPVNAWLGGARCVCGAAYLSPECARRAHLRGPSVPLDPQPWVWIGTVLRSATCHEGEEGMLTFSPRPGYSENQEDYAS